MESNISEYITFKEATLSPTAVRLGIDNTPDEHILKRMKIVANKCFEPIRKYYGKPICVNSFYRCLELNNAIGGSSKTSQHMMGEAIDIDFGQGNNAEMFYWIIKNLEFDQVIWEYGTDQEPAWVHISFTEQRPNRNEALAVKMIDGKAVWRKVL